MTKNIKKNEGKIPTSKKSFVLSKYNDLFNDISNAIDDIFEGYRITNKEEQKFIYENMIKVIEIRKINGSKQSNKHEKN